jgi:CDP-diacylglycerol pyrophosphatase
MNLPGFSRRLLIGAAVLAVAAGSGFGWWQHGRETLWRIVSEQCVPLAHAGKPTPCVETNEQAVVLKDRVGPLQYLVMPTVQLTGIEDPGVLGQAASQYWSQAWSARKWMEARHGTAIPRDVVAITVNSAYARSQDQLHLHVSCVRGDLADRLRSIGSITRDDAWTELPGGWHGHPYQVRRVTAESLDGLNPFDDLLPESVSSRSRQAIAVIGASFQGRPGFLMLRTHTDFWSAWRAAIEGDVQDHTCAVLRRDNAPAQRSP